MTYKVVQWVAGSVGNASLMKIIHHPGLEGIGILNPKFSRYANDARKRKCDRSGNVANNHDSGDIDDTHAALILMEERNDE